MNTIANCDSDIIPFLYASVASAFERNESGVLVEINGVIHRVSIRESVASVYIVGSII